MSGASGRRLLRYPRRGDALPYAGLGMGFAGGRGVLGDQESLHPPSGRIAQVLRSTAVRMVGALAAVPWNIRRCRGARGFRGPHIQESRARHVARRMEESQEFEAGRLPRGMNEEILARSAFATQDFRPEKSVPGVCKMKAAFSTGAGEKNEVNSVGLGCRKRR